MAVSVTYNNELIASLEAGQTATLPCAGKVMEGDVVVASDESAGDENVLLTLFYITDGAYTYTRGFTFAEGQTWSQFCNGANSGTEYACFYCSGNCVYYACDIATSEYDGGGREIYDVSPDSVIQKGKTYMYIISSGGASN